MVLNWVYGDIRIGDIVVAREEVGKDCPDHTVVLRRRISFLGRGRGGLETRYDHHQQSTHDDGGNQATATEKWCTRPGRA